MARGTGSASILFLLACHGHSAPPAAPISARPPPDAAVTVPTPPTTPTGTLRLEGQVITPDDMPAAGATIDLSTVPPRSTTSASDGYYFFDNLAAGSYALTAHTSDGATVHATTELTPTSDPVILHLAK